MRTPFVAGNWKMHPGALSEAIALAADLRRSVGGITGVTRLVCPPFTAIAAVSEALSGSDVAVGAQNVHPEPRGAFTGEVSASMLTGLCTHVLVGHSERRRLLGETDAFIGAKLAAALRTGLTPVLCVGETLDEREANRAATVVDEQLRGGLSGLDAGAVRRVVVAYEPVWAIGTGRAAGPETAQEMMGTVRSSLAALADGPTAEAALILYGGSGTPTNAPELAAQPDIDGALVGGASLVADEFAAIVRAFAG